MYKTEEISNVDTRIAFFLERKAQKYPKLFRKDKKQKDKDVVLTK